MNIIVQILREGLDTFLVYILQVFFNLKIYLTDSKYSIQYNDKLELTMPQPQSSVEVCIRLQPPSSDHLNEIDSRNLLCVGKQYSYDHIFSANATQQEIFNRVGLKIIANAKKGYNSCVFVYGQTGSGKTYTMTGTSSEAGILQRCIQQLWSTLQQFDSFQLKMNYFEIYNEQVNDLLAKNKKNKNVKIKESLTLGFYLENIEEIKVETEEDIILNLQKGIKNRSTAQTKMNRESSRSHSIFTLVVTTRQRKQEVSESYSIKNSKIHFVDLAGSEKQKSTQAIGERLKQASNINKSLTSLSIVIEKLSSKANHIPYRDSVLTKILRDSLGGNSKTILIATLSSKQTAISETVSTLNFAAKAKKVKLSAKVNEEYEGSIANMRKMIQSLEEQIKNLKNKQKNCDECLTLQRDYENLQQKISELEKQVSYYKEAYCTLKEESIRYSQKSDPKQINTFFDNQMETIEERSEIASSPYKPQVTNLLIEELRAELINLNSQLNLKDQQISKLVSQFSIIEKAEWQNFRPLLEKFSENLHKLKINECREQIEQALYLKLGVLNKQLKLEKQTNIKNRQIFQKTIYDYKMKIQQISQMYLPPGMRNPQIIHMQEQMDIEASSKETIQINSSKRKFKELLQIQKKASQQLKQEYERLEINYYETVKKMEDFQVKYSQTLVSLEECRAVSKFWEEKYQKSQATIDVMTQKTIDQQREQRLYEQDLVQKSKSMGLFEQQIKIQNQKMKAELNKAIQQNNDLSDKITQLCKSHEILKAEKISLMKTKQSGSFALQEKEQIIKSLHSKVKEWQQKYENNYDLLLKEQQEQNRLKEHLQITTSQFNKILEIKEKQMNEMSEQASNYYIKGTELADALKSCQLLYQELQAQNTLIKDKLGRVDRKYKDLRAFIKQQQTVAFQDQHKIQEENTLLRDNLERHHQRIQLMKEQLSFKNKQIEDLKEELNRERKWAKNFAIMKKQITTKKQEENSMQRSHKRSNEIIQNQTMDLSQRNTYWEIVHSKIELCSLVEKIGKVLKMDYSPNPDNLNLVTQRIDEMQGKMDEFDMIRLQNQKLKARNRYLSETRNSGFLDSLKEV